MAKVTGVLCHDDKHEVCPYELAGGHLCVCECHGPAPAEAPRPATWETIPVQVSPPTTDPYVRRVAELVAEMRAEEAAQSTSEKVKGFFEGLFSYFVVPAMLLGWALASILFWLAVSAVFKAIGAE